MTKRPKILFLVALFCSSLAIAEEPIKALHRAQAYTALMNVLKQQGNLDKLLIIKHPQQAIRTFMKDAATYAKKMEERVEQWRTNDPTIVTQNDGFPPLESKARSGIESEMSKRLLLGSGKKFAKWMLISQIQSAQYLQRLVEALKDSETNAERKAQLEKDAEAFEKLKDRAFSLL